MRCPWCSNAAATAGSSTTRDGAATLPCFIDSTTSLSSAWLKPSTSTVYAGSPALPMPNPDLPATSFTAYVTPVNRLPSGIVCTYRSNAATTFARSSSSSRRTVGSVAQDPVEALGLGDPVEQLHPRAQPRPLQHLVHHPVGRAQVQRERAVVGGLAEPAHLVEVRADVAAHQLGDRVVGDRLAPAQQREARREPGDVPGEVPEVGLVEVVHVEDQDAVAVHVRAEVLGVQVALDPHPARPLVGPRVVARRRRRRRTGRRCPGRTRTGRPPSSGTSPGTPPGRPSSGRRTPSTSVSTMTVVRSESVTPR